MHDISTVLSFLGSVIRLSAPILFVALGVLIVQLAGIVNMGAEGMMLIGCMIGVIVTIQTGNVWIGTLVASAVVGLIGLLFAFLAVDCQVNQVVLGVAFNIFGTGITTTLIRGAFGLTSVMVPDTFKTDALGMSAPIYLAFIMAIVCSIFLYKTKLGLKIRAVGEYPKAVETVGLSVRGLRYLACFIGCFLIGFGGAYMACGQVNMFIEGMTDGRGYIALAAVTFGKYTPIGTMLAVLLFGAGEALQYRLQASNSIVPYQFALMIPYILTIIALALFVKNAKDPAALGVPYKKSK